MEPATTAPAAPGFCGVKNKQSDMSNDAYISEGDITGLDCRLDSRCLSTGRMYRLWI